MPPGWDERYITVFNSSYDEVGVEGLESMTHQAALRGPGRSSRSPGPALLPPGLYAARALAARPRARESGRDRRARGSLQARPGDARAAVRHDPPAGQPRSRPVAGDDLPVGVHRPRHRRRWHLTVDNGSSSVAQGPAPSARPAPARSPTRTGWTSSASAWTRCGRSRRGGCARAATRSRCEGSRACSLLLRAGRSRASPTCYWAHR